MRTPSYSPPSLSFRQGTLWLTLFVMTRGLVLAILGLLLAAERLTANDDLVAWLLLCHFGLTIAVALRARRTFHRPAWWFADIAVSCAFILASDEWPSPFFLLSLTALAPAVATLPFRRALAFGTVFILGSMATAVATGLTTADLSTAPGVEIFATQLLLPVVITFGIAYAADALRKLDAEQLRGQRLALETERRRIAWELHDSAKQRLHAAHLVLSSLPPSEPLELGLEQLRGAVADMETSIGELRSPLEGRSLEEALRMRAAELATLDPDVVVTVVGHAASLDPMTASHAYRILAEAMTNAIRHAGAREIRVRLGTDERGGLEASVHDDGRGLPASIRPGANGLRTMHSRAFAIDGRLSVHSDEPPGTRVELEVPPSRQGVPA